MGDFQIILQTSGDNKLLWKNMVFLDYPDIPVECVNLDCEFGSFGQPRSGTNCRFFCWLFGKKNLVFSFLPATPSFRFRSLEKAF